ncbi:hypothetical protein ACOTTU_17050 [Roseobacter sp. EG26]|uniref:hypothetical protein n=1 Tax=Roseobacter sp. EG26 TaxID=3412477 RepID=UPI003CE4E26F
MRKITNHKKTETKRETRLLYPDQCSEEHLGHKTGIGIWRLNDYQDKKHLPRQSFLGYQYTPLKRHIDQPWCPPKSKGERTKILNDTISEFDEMRLFLLEDFLASSKALSPVLERVLLVREMENTVPPLPTKAPVLWSERESKRGLTPVQWIEQHYSQWLRTEDYDPPEHLLLTSPALRSLDGMLYNAYAQWISPHRHPEDDLALPSKSDISENRVRKIVNVLREHIDDFDISDLVAVTSAIVRNPEIDM